MRINVLLIPALLLPAITLHAEELSVPKADWKCGATIGDALNQAEASLAHSDMDRNARRWLA